MYGNQGTGVRKSDCLFEAPQDNRQLHLDLAGCYTRMATFTKALLNKLTTTYGPSRPIEALFAGEIKKVDVAGAMATFGVFAPYAPTDRMRSVFGDSRLECRTNC
ncbi:hypothetical protein B0O80DRAFT_502195 [Mortierella sp. GBAus27b]|nr:hypothetical protein B0O80DRAFT_502195 [Mortierella sp. GBAus27b]